MLGGRSVGATLIDRPKPPAGLSLFATKEFPMKARPTDAPKTLSPEARKRWRTVRDDFAISDSAGLLLLETAFEAFDLMRLAQKLVREEGATQVDGRGTIRAHPAVAIERDARSAMLSSLKALRLDLEPVGDIGRPPGD